MYGCMGTVRMYTYECVCMEPSMTMYVLMSRSGVGCSRGFSGQRAHEGFPVSGSRSAAALGVPLGSRQQVRVGYGRVGWFCMHA